MIRKKAWSEGEYVNQTDKGIFKTLNRTDWILKFDVLLERTEKMKAEGSAMFGYKLPLSGKEIMELKGMNPGPEIKECLEYLLKLALVNPLRDREEFVKHVRGYRIENQQNCDGDER